MLDKKKSRMSATLDAVEPQQLLLICSVAYWLTFGFSVQIALLLLPLLLPLGPQA